MRKIANYKASGDFLSIRNGLQAYGHYEKPEWNGSFYKSQNKDYHYCGFASYKYPKRGGLYKRIESSDDWELIEVDGCKI